MKDADPRGRTGLVMCLALDSKKWRGKQSEVGESREGSGEARKDESGDTQEERRRVGINHYVQGQNHLVPLLAPFEDI